MVCLFAFDLCVGRIIVVFKINTQVPAPDVPCGTWGFHSGIININIILLNKS